MRLPNKLIADAIKANPRASEKELKDTVWSKLTNDDRAAIFSYWFANAYRSFEVEIEAGSVAVRKRMSERRKDRKKASASIKTKLEFALMDHMLSNGKLLRDATFADCEREGGWLTRIAKLGKGNEVVGRKLTEADLLNLHKRNSK